MSNDKGLNYLESLQNQQPALAARITSFADLFQRKLWHQLTVLIEESLSLPEFRTPDVLIPFYQKFVNGFAHKLNPLRLAHIAVTVAEQYSSPQEAGGVPLFMQWLHFARKYILTCLYMMNNHLVFTQWVWGLHCLSIPRGKGVSSQP